MCSVLCWNIFSTHLYFGRLEGHLKENQKLGRRYCVTSQLKPIKLQFDERNIMASGRYIYIYDARACTRGTGTPTRRLFSRIAISHRIWSAWLGCLLQFANMRLTLGVLSYGYLPMNFRYFSSKIRSKVNGIHWTKSLIFFV